MNIKVDRQSCKAIELPDSAGMGVINKHNEYRRE